MRTDLALVLVAVALFACGRGDRPPLLRAALERDAPLASPQGGGALPLDSAQMAELVDDVARLRGLRPGSGVTIETHDALDYDAKLRPYRELLAEQVELAAPARAEHLATHAWTIGVSAAHYSPSTRSIHVRTRPDLSAAELGFVLAHEVEHALQHTSFGDRPSHLRGDAELAHDALVEGDAELTARLYLAQRLGMSRRRALHDLADPDLVTRTLEQLRAEPRAARAVFPYAAGERFAAELVRAGGFPLLDRAFRDPPATSEQILHPEKYFAGELGEAIAPPDPPRDMVLEEAGTRGELETLLLLQPCAPPERARRAAAGWGGDTLATFVGARGQASLWSTVWDSERDARELEALAQPCFAGALVLRRGARVAVVEGLPPREARAAALAMLARPLRRSSEVALRWQLVPREPLPERTPGAIDGAVFRSRWLGVEAELPAEARATIDESVDGRLPAELGLRLAHGWAVLFAWEHQSGPAQDSRIVTAVERQYAHGALRHIRTDAVDTRLGPAREIVYDDLGLELRLLIVPVCEGAGSLVLVRAGHDASARTALDRLAASLAPLGRERAPLCQRLDPR